MDATQALRPSTFWPASTDMQIRIHCDAAVRGGSTTLGVAPGCFRLGAWITPRRLFELRTVNECWLKLMDKHLNEEKKDWQGHTRRCYATSPEWWHLLFSWELLRCCSTHLQVAAASEMMGSTLEDSEIHRKKANICTDDYGSLDI